MSFEVKSLYERLKQLHNQRKVRGKRYELALIMTLNVLAKLSGQDTGTGIAGWVKWRGEPLRQALGTNREQMLPHGYQSRATPDVPCTLVLSYPQWQALYAFTHRTTRLPSIPPTLHQATQWIAQLGGFLARKTNGEPGVKVLWRGWMRLHDILQTWLISHPQDVGNA